MSRTLTLLLLGAAALHFLSAAAAAHPATGIVFDGASRLYFSDLETIWRLDPDGRLAPFRPGRGGEHVHELSIDERGNVYGATVAYEPSTHKWITSVWRRSPDGSETFVVAPTEDPPLALTIWRQRDGSTYFFDQNNHTKTSTVLLKRTPEGKVETVAGGAFGHADGRGREARFKSIAGMAFGPDGSLYVTDAGALRRVFPDGTVRTVVADLGAGLPDDSPLGFGGPSGLAVDAGGNVYVADSGNRRLLKVTPDGRVERLLRAEPPWSLNGVAATPDGRLLVLETSFTPPNIHAGPRLRQLSPDGKVTLLASLDDKQKAQALQASRAASDSNPERNAASTETANRVLIERGFAACLGLGFLGLGALLCLKMFRS